MSHSSNSDGTAVKILCGTCHSPTETVPDPQPQDQVTCVGCGKQDSFENVMRAVGDYAAHRAANYLSDSFRRATRGNKFVKFTSKTPQHRSFPWVTSDMGI